MSRPLPRQGSADSSPFPPTAHLQMDNDNHTSDVSKGSCTTICYSIGCHNPATTSVKIWHFGIDTLDSYGKEGFHVTFEEGMSDVYRIYTKRKGSKDIVRVEHQEYPNQAVADAFVQKYFRDGRLVVRGDEAAD